MIFEINNTDWVELDGDDVVGGSMPILTAEAYVTTSMRMKSLEDTLVKFVNRTARNWSRNKNIEAGDLENDIWVQLLKLRDDPERWTIRYLRNKVIWAAKTAINKKPPLIEFVDEIVPPAALWSDFIAFLDQLNNARYRDVMKLVAVGDSIDSIAQTLNLTKTQASNAKKKGLIALQKMASTMSEDDKNDLLG